MNISLPRIIIATGLAFAIFAAGAAQIQAKTGSKPDSAQNQAEELRKAGEQAFANNCSRCHAAPMSLSSRTTGTVVMHMRVRARLSREDEKLLLKYLAP
jgi:cytochrome c5